MKLFKPKGATATVKENIIQENSLSYMISKQIESEKEKLDVMLEQKKKYNENLQAFLLSSLS